MSEFFDRCERVEQETGVELIDTYTDGGSPEIFEDDGILHVIEGMERAAFDVGENQTLCARKQNANTTKVLKALGKSIPREAII